MLHGKGLEVNFVRSVEKHLVRVSAAACCEVLVVEEQLVGLLHTAQAAVIAQIVGECL